MAFVGGPKAIELELETARILFETDKVVVGGCGIAQELGQAWGWLYDLEGKPPKIKGSEFVAITDKRLIYLSENLTNWMLCDQPFFAIGSGMHFAIAALEAGTSVRRAVEIACKYDKSSGFDILEWKV